MLETIKKQIAELRASISSALLGEQQFRAVKTDKAVLVHDGEELNVGTAVYVEDEEGNRTPAPDDTYTLEDRSRVTVVDGRVTEVLEAETELEADPQSDDRPRDGEVTRGDIEGIYKEINELYKLIDGVMAKIGTTRNELDARMSKIESTPAAKHPEQEYKSNIERHAEITDERLKYVREYSRRKE